MEEERKNAAGEQAEEITQTVGKSTGRPRQKPGGNERKGCEGCTKAGKGTGAPGTHCPKAGPKKPHASPHLREKALFELWVGGFEKEHQALLREYFDGLNAHLSLARDEVIQFRLGLHRRDLHPLLQLGCPTGGSPDPVSYPERLGGLYAWPATLWFRLDDAAQNLSPVHEARADVCVPAGGGSEGAGEKAGASADRPAFHHPAFSRLCHHRAQGLFLALSGSDQTALLHPAGDGYSRPTAAKDRRQRLSELPGAVL